MFKGTKFPDLMKPSPEFGRPNPIIWDPFNQGNINTILYDKVFREPTGTHCELTTFSVGISLHQRDLYICSLQFYHEI